MDGVQALGKEGQAWSARVETTKRDVREKKKKKKDLSYQVLERGFIRLAYEMD